jgi:hypothetical protein
MDKPNDGSGHPTLQLQNLLGILSQGRYIAQARTDDKP